jgi:hypothetical protein
VFQSLLSIRYLRVHTWKFVEALYIIKKFVIMNVSFISLALDATHVTSLLNGLYHREVLFLDGNRVRASLDPASSRTKNAESLSSRSSERRGPFKISVQAIRISQMRGRERTGSKTISYNKFWNIWIQILQARLAGKWFSSSRTRPVLEPWLKNRQFKIRTHSCDLNTVLVLYLDIHCIFNT